MLEAIENFADQFLYEPEVEGSSAIRAWKSLIVGGMGGSHFAGDFLKMYKPPYTVFVHTDYGLPDLPEDILAESLFIASSYSGNTEETLDFARSALEEGYDVAVIATGGELFDFAVDNDLPRVMLPDTGIQPRAAFGYSLLALLAILGEEGIILSLKEEAGSIVLSELEEEAVSLSDFFSGSVPHIYASRKNWSLAYFWKVNMNESAKIPSFCNYLPELNHNEINAFGDANYDKASPNKFLFLRSEDDNPRTETRMSATADIYRANNIEVADLPLQASISHRIIYSCLLAMWTSTLIAEERGVDPDLVPVIEDFKKRIA